MRRAREEHRATYMQILGCINVMPSTGLAVGSHHREIGGPISTSDDNAADHNPLDAGLNRDEPSASDAMTDVEDEMDPEAYGFGV